MTAESTAFVPLRALRDRPIALLQEMERRARGSAAGGAHADDRAWVGLAFRLGPEMFLAARDEVREVLSWPPRLTRVPGAKNWVRGLISTHGQLLPVIDLRQFLGSGVTSATRSTRILVLNHREIPAALMVDEVPGFARCAPSDYEVSPPPPLVRCDRYVIGGFRYAGVVCPVLGLKRMVESPGFLLAAS
jgi:twitching motility protein PilI